MAQNATTGSHQQLIEAFKSIRDLDALAWSIMDAKSEHVITNAIAWSANRIAGTRVARVEYRGRTDLAFLEDGAVHSLYEAKAAFLHDYTPRRVARRDKWLGDVLNRDFDKVAAQNAKMSGVRTAGCVFYLYEIADPSLHAKYRAHSNPLPPEEAIQRMRSFVKGRFNSSHVIDCGKADGTNVKVHLVIFDLPDPTSGGA